MWLLLLLTTANACLKTEWINSTYLRFNISTFPVNVYDVLIVVGLAWSLLPKGQFYFETERPHPALSWALVLFLLAVISGGIGALHNGADARHISTAARNLFEVPLLIYLGYRLMPRPGSLLFFCYFLVVIGVITSILISTSFGGQIEDLQGGRDITTVRVINFLANYAGLAAALLLFSVGSGDKPLFSPWISVLLAAGCFAGEFATLSRSDWLAMSAGIGAAIVIMPRYHRGSKIAFVTIVIPIMAAVLYTGMLVASSISGKDVVAKMRDRVISMLPGEHEGVKVKAWDTRLSGAVAEISLWSQSPIIGKGFGIQDTQPDDYISWRHNTWTSTLAESGLIGFSAMALLCVGQVVVGRRMVRDRLDRSSVLIGALGVITGVHFIVFGYCTMSFNQIRCAIPLALTFGTVMRCRMMQLSMMRQYEGCLAPSSDGTADYDSLIDEGSQPAHIQF